MIISKPIKMEAYARGWEERKLSQFSSRFLSILLLKVIAVLSYRAVSSVKEFVLRFRQGETRPQSHLRDIQVYQSVVNIYLEHKWWSFYRPKGNEKNTKCHVVNCPTTRIDSILKDFLTHSLSTKSTELGLKEFMIISFSTDQNSYRPLPFILRDVPRVLSSSSSRQDAF